VAAKIAKSYLGGYGGSRFVPPAFQWAGRCLSGNMSHIVKYYPHISQSRLLCLSLSVQVKQSESEYYAKRDNKERRGDNGSAVGVRSEMYGRSWQELPLMLQMSTIN